MNTINTCRSLSQMLLALIVCSALTTTAYSEEVTYPTNFYATGDTLTADDLNTKFNDIKAGINGNYNFINNYGTTINTNSTNINKNTTAVNANTTRTTDNGTAITNNGTAININGVGILNNSNAISTNSDKINSVITTATDNDFRIGVNINDISVLNARTTAATPSQGDMQYYDEATSSWVLIEAPTGVSPGSTSLNFCKGTPTWGVCTYAIGDTGPAGGIVFYITDGGTRGLEAAPSDQSNSVWGCIGVAIAGADGRAIGTGKQNTADILQGCTTDSAAKVADTYSLNGYYDWFLPSMDELNELWLHRDVVGGFVEQRLYWSSTDEITNDAGAWGLGWRTAFWGLQAKSNDYHGVRAIRAF